MKDATHVLEIVARLFPWGVVLALGLVLRRPLHALCVNLRRLKVKDWEGEWFEPGQTQPAGGAGDEGSPANLECVRTGIYRQQQGLFLSYELRPSKKPKQLFDVGIFVVGHVDQSRGKQPPLTEISRVEYQLGPRFGRRPAVSRDADHRFRINTSAYGPFACVARVHFRDPDKQPLILSLYVYFATERD